ncbi:MAG: hypothetical protein KGN84_18765 [Acidobacteriota bacterium]|nr:hypothetical protein [Acidobacteriota bacterium]
MRLGLPIRQMEAGDARHDGEFKRQRQMRSPVLMAILGIGLERGLACASVPSQRIVWVQRGNSQAFVARARFLTVNEYADNMMRQADQTSKRQIGFLIPFQIVAGDGLNIGMAQLLALPKHYQ